MRPHCIELSASGRTDLAVCREMIRGGSRSFFAASLLLPPRVSAPAFALYAFCRAADDAVDELASPRESVAAVSALRERLDAIYSGRPRAHPVDRAFGDVVAQHDIPRALPEALLEGFEWDARGRRYATLEEIEDYGARVAGSVGAMMCLLMGVAQADVIARACELGVAMQLTNIARDVGEDARRGRLYLPADSLAAHGIDAERWIERPSFDGRLAAVVESLLQRSEALYARAERGIGHLPRTCRPGIMAARRLYAEIGREVARKGFDSVTARARVSRVRKTALTALAMASAITPVRPLNPAPLRATRFLVDAASGRTRARLPDPPAGGLLSLFAIVDKLERRDAERAS